MTRDFGLSAKLWRQVPAKLFSVFLVVGLLNTAVGYAIYLIGLAANAAPAAALAIATVLGAAFNYASTGFIVFKNRSLGRLPHFFGAYALTYLLNAGALEGLTTLGLGPAVAQLLLLPFAAVLSFSLFRLYVFKEVRRS